MRRDQRRAANNKLKRAVQVNKCTNCGAAVMPHRICPGCGFYGGKKLIEGSAD